MNTFAQQYLRHYGYLYQHAVAADDAGNATPTFTAAVIAFQRQAGLPETGILDTDTVQRMSQPRCGVRDQPRQLQEWARWRKTQLSYFIEKRVRGLSEPDVDALIEQAWQDWTRIAGIRVQPTTDRAGADIVISTGRGRADGFDGPSGVLAWAYLPTGNDGQLLCRFDYDETWVKEPGQGGILFRNVACHEFGHLLGLDHSNVPTALMAPFYSPAVVSPQAHDDIPRIQALYGPAAPPPPPPPPPNPTRFTVNIPTQDVVRSSWFDAGHVPAFTVTGTIGASAEALNLPPLVRTLLRLVCSGAIPLPPNWAMLVQILCGLVPQDNRQALAMPPWLVPLLREACKLAPHLPSPYNLFAQAVCALLPAAAATTPCVCR